jgi:hypothetical protein
MICRLSIIGGGQLCENLKFISCITEQNSLITADLLSLIGATAMLTAALALSASPVRETGLAVLDQLAPG